jgi:hypothetical protein
MRMKSRSRGRRLPGRRIAGAVAPTADDVKDIALSIADRESLSGN